MDQVELTKGKTASDILLDALQEVRLSFPADYSTLAFPIDTKQLKSRYVEFLPEFEAIRLDSPKRLDIAQQLVAKLTGAVIWSGTESLQDHLKSPVNPLPLTHYPGNAKARWQFEIDYQNRCWNDVSRLAQRLVERNVMTGAAADSLRWVGQNLPSLSQRKVVVLGAGAEMASTELFLKLGAEVLWIDKAPPPARWQAQNDFSGMLRFCTADLLTQPGEVAATIRAFAGSNSVDMCLYAYAPGQARETRLTVVMNEIVNSLPKSMLASITMLVSPTTPSALSDDDLDSMNVRRAKRPGWEGALDSIGVFGRLGGATQGNRSAVCHSVVSIQGVSYQVAQYIGKILMAELWHAEGYRVSANTAAITKTRSLEHPVFDAAFGGAESLSVETFTVKQSQCLSGLLSVADWLSEQRPIPGAVRIHGGIHCLPYPLELALRPAAAIGFMKRPQLIAGFFK